MHGWRATSRRGSPSARLGDGLAHPIRRRLELLRVPATAAAVGALPPPPAPSHRWQQLPLTAANLLHLLLQMTGSALLYKPRPSWSSFSSTGSATAFLPATVPSDVASVASSGMSSEPAYASFEEQQQEPDEYELEFEEDSGGSSGKMVVDGGDGGEDDAAAGGQESLRGRGLAVVTDQLGEVRSLHPIDLRLECSLDAAQ